MIHIGNVTIPLRDFAVARTGFLGITKSGKTYGAKGVAEQLMDHGIPIVVFDAIGVWRFLKRPADENGRGYKVVVAGGEEPDLPLTPTGALEIIRAAMKQNVSVVIDLYDKRLSKKQWRDIVRECFRTILYENKSVRTVILEETPEFAPQKILDGETYAEVEKLARMGGNHGIGLIMIAQRSQEVNKAVLELCDNMVLMRQRGSNAIDSLEKWMNRVDPEVATEIAKALPGMQPGECFVWAEDSMKPVMTKVESLLAARLAGMERIKADAAKAVKTMQQILNGEIPIDVSVRKHDPFTIQPATTPHAIPVNSKTEKVGDLAMTPRYQALINALGFYESVIHAAQIGKNKLASFVGRSNDGGFRNDLSALRTAGIVDYPSAGEISLTELGTTLITEVPAIGSNADLHQYWMEKRRPPLQPRYVKLLEILLRAYPNCIEKNALAASAERENDGGFRNDLSAMRTLGIIDYPKTGHAVASENLFPFPN
jgi:hypothetical protein